MLTMKDLLERSSLRHTHLCPRQVLGVRMGMMASKHMQFDLPQSEKRLLTIIETDGCFADGIEITTGCSVGHRTLLVRDMGKVAAVFVDTKTEDVFRIAPHLDIRDKVDHYGIEGKNRWTRQLLGYQRMPEEELLSLHHVTLSTPINQIVSRPGVRSNCSVCGEEIINERETIIAGEILCRSCEGYSYYSPKPSIAYDEILLRIK